MGIGGQELDDALVGVREVVVDESRAFLHVPFAPVRIAVVDDLMEQGERPVVRGKSPPDHDAIVQRVDVSLGDLVAARAEGRQAVPERDVIGGVEDSLKDGGKHAYWFFIFARRVPSERKIDQ